MSDNQQEKRTVGELLEVSAIVVCGLAVVSGCVMAVYVACTQGIQVAPSGNQTPNAYVDNYYKVVPVPGYPHFSGK